MAKATVRRHPEVKRALALLREATDLLLHEGYRIEQAYLYGSFAKGSPGRWSDIDVAFVSPDYRPADIKQWARIARICQKVDIRMEPIIYRPEDFPDKDPLAAEIRRIGIALSMPAGK